MTQKMLYKLLALMVAMSVVLFVAYMYQQHKDTSNTKTIVEETQTVSEQPVVQIPVDDSEAIVGDYVELPDTEDYSEYNGNDIAVQKVKNADSDFKYSSDLTCDSTKLSDQTNNLFFTDQSGNTLKVVGSLIEAYCEINDLNPLNFDPLSDSYVFISEQDPIYYEFSDGDHSIRIYYVSCDRDEQLYGYLVEL